MTKYDKVFNSQKTLTESLTPEEAVAAIAVVTAIADASVEEIDPEGLAGILWQFEVFEEYSEDELVEIVDKLIDIAESQGLSPLFNTANESLTEEVVLDGFAAGVVTLLDEEQFTIPKSKEPFLKKLQEALELEDEEADEITKEIIAAFQAGENAEYLDEEEGILTEVEYVEDVYESPLGNFTVPIPVDAEQGGRIQTQEGVVGFSDDFGTLLRIDYYPIPPEQLEELESEGQEEYLKTILVDKYVPQAILANLPDSQIKYGEYLEDIFAGAYYALVDMPKGSTMSQQENNGSSTRLDAYRGLLTFINGEFLYIVSSQRSFLNGETPNAIAEEAEYIKDNILSFVETMEFS
ncbi:hypothetical protein ACX27_04865 [Nostoc piscinale CENA21]|uniref:Uncharacterized protein n=1 Tax=Nostoc piscinale CENA21 TaxID=224013 RepID=A0A0M4TYZ4_9NOSO|nr:hypothetical protein [Nostoc piscinale]ALF56256.1 hypothetical protein ACX27_04865 [Nostoc piscinale CENA21]